MAPLPRRENSETMFRMTALDVQVSTEAAALRLLGCGDVVVGPVVFGGARFWASIAVDEREVARRRRHGIGALDDEEDLKEHLAAGRPPAVRLQACLVRDSDPDHALQRASLLAGYAPRAVLVDESVDMLSVAVDAALLDQGLIVLRADGRLDVVATPGPRVDGRGLDVRELALRERTYAA